MLTLYAAFALQRKYIFNYIELINNKKHIFDTPEWSFVTYFGFKEMKIVISDEVSFLSSQITGIKSQLL